MAYYSLPGDLSFLKEVYPGWGALIEKANERMLTSKDVKRILGLSYRQLTDWEKRGMLKSIFARPMSERTEGWRRFSVLDLLCLGLLKEAKKHGISITKLQNFMSRIFSIGGLLYGAIPYIVYGFEVFLYTNLDDWIDIASPVPRDKRFGPPIDDLRKSNLVVIFPLNRIAEGVLKKLRLPDFQAIKKPMGNYSFVINGVPLALEQLPDQEKDREVK
jgi:hypothetical protein